MAPDLPGPLLRISLLATRTDVHERCLSRCLINHSALFVAVLVSATRHWSWPPSYTPEESDWSWGLIQVAETEGSLIKSSSKTTWENHWWGHSASSTTDGTKTDLSASAHNGAAFSLNTFLFSMISCMFHTCTKQPHVINYCHDATLISLWTCYCSIMRTRNIL